jgi:methylglutaconyl-CoA hydratase
MPKPTVMIEYFAVSDKASVAFVTLNRPEVRNAFDRPTLQALKNACEEIGRRQAEVRLCVLRGAGGHFCAGADLNWMKAAGALDDKANLAEAEWLISCFEAVYRLPVPTLALVEGNAYGGGAGLVAACDWAMAKTTARFALPETRLGNVAASILPYLVNKTGAGAIRRWVISGRAFGAQAALRAGLVEVVVDESEWDDAIAQEIQGVLLGEPEAQRSFKKLHQNYGVGGSLPSSKDLAIHFSQRRVGAPAREGFAAFLDKRPPEWAISLKPGEFPWKKGMA